MTSLPIADSAERERALDPTCSFIVQAPAGSGKTELLIQRYLALLATVESPEEIVAITFTIKAADEMRGRVLAALKAARDGKPPADEREARTRPLAFAAVRDDERKGWGMAENPTRLRIQTIDALCASLTRQMPVLSRFGASPATVEDASELYREAAWATLELVESNDKIARDVACILAHLDNDAARLAALIEAMLGRRESFSRLAELNRDGLEAALAGERTRVIARAAALYPGIAPGDVDGWQALARRLIVNAGTWRKQSAEAQALAGRAESEALREALIDVRELPPARYTEAQWEVLAAIGNVLRYAMAELKLVFQARRQVDFAEVAHATLVALGEEGAPSDIALKLDYRIRHLLIDEFQDTSITQYRLIARLTGGWEPGDGRTLFAVGDPMQSIYRFREAEVGEFLRTWETGRIADVALERLRLKTNFRSQAGVVDWVNATFAPIMPEVEEVAAGAVPYAPSVARHPALPDAAVQVHPFFDGDEQSEAARVVDMIMRLKQEDSSQAIAVLVRNRDHLRAIAPRLRAAGLRFRAVEIEALGNRPVVQDLHALTRALGHPADRLAWLAVLRAPWCGLTLADLSALAEAEDARTVWALMNDEGSIARLSADGVARLRRMREALAPLIAGRLRGTLRDCVERAWLGLGGPACVEDETDLEDVDVYLGALEEVEEAGMLPDLAAFEARLAKLWALPDVHATERDAQLMTIHKAKGLEFDHVFVPGLGRKPRSDDQRLFLWATRPAHEDGELLLAPIEEAGGETDPIYKWLKKLNAERDAHEATRLLYVAATRARRGLHLLGDVTPKGERVAPRANTLLATLWPAVRARFEEAAAQQPMVDRAVARGSAPLDQSVNRLASDWRLAAPPVAVAWRSPAEEVLAQDDIEFSWVGETARQVGAIAHRWLQCMADDGLADWDAARIERLRAAVRNDLAARGVLAIELDAAASRVLGALGKAIQSTRGRWILGPHPSAYTEHRVTALIDGTVRRMVIDRLFETASGERWIVDYKTSMHEGAGIEGFLDRERERYTAQLLRYARAIGGAPKLGLYFPLLSGWREL